MEVMSPINESVMVFVQHYKHMSPFNRSVMIFVQHYKQKMIKLLSINNFYNLIVRIKIRWSKQKLKQKY